MPASLDHPAPARATSAPSSALASSTVAGVQARRWQQMERLLAGLLVVVVAMRFQVGGNLTVGDLLAWAMVPMWLPVLRRYRGALLLLGTGLLACASCYYLTRVAAVDHHVNMKLAWAVIKMVGSLVASVGIILWARTRLAPAALFTLYGLGMLVARPTNAKLFAENPWKFHVSVPMTIIVVALVQSERRPRTTLAALAGFAALCTLTDARSNLSVLVLTMVLVMWRLLPGFRTRRSTVLGTLFTLGAVGIAAYYALQAAILDGALGEETRARSVEQLRQSGSLIAGGRPELGASRALLELRPFGFGGGTYLNTHDLLVAKDGMLELGYDPNNGYVDRFMFGRGIELHSTTFDLWAWCGIGGVLLAAVVLGIVLAGLGHRLNTAPVAGAVPIFCSLLTLWDLLFSPYFSSLPVMVLVLATALVSRDTPHPSRPRRILR